MLRNDGFDVSHWQGPDFPWEWSREQGHELASCKATQGTQFVDPTFRRNRRVMAETGFRFRGVYTWIEPDQDIGVQVDHFIDTVGDLALGEFVQIDAEQAPLTSGQMQDALVRLQDHYPDRIIMYTGLTFAHWSTQTAAKGTPWWLAWYGPQSFDALRQRAISKFHFPVPWTPVVWQWGGGAEGEFVPAIGKRVDSNEIIDRAALEVLAGYKASDLTPTGRATARSRAMSAPVTRDRLGPGETLDQGDMLISADGATILVHQEDGNVVAYHGKAVWSTNTAGLDTDLLVMQDDGNLVLYGADGPVWATGTFGSGGDALIVQDDQNVVAYAGQNPVWSSQSDKGPTPARTTKRTVTVEDGDGWIAVAERAGCDWRYLASANGGLLRVLHPGEILVVP